MSGVREMQGTTFLQMQTPVAPGSSGGPLFDVDGRVLGVNTASKDPGMNLAVHVKHVRELLAAVPQRRALATYTSGARVSGISVEGAELSAEDRMGMQDGLELFAAAAEGCVDDSNANRFVTVTFTRPAEAGGSIFQWVMHPKIDSDLPAGARACLSSSLQLFSMGVGMAMAQAFGEELAAGKAVVLHAPIAVGFVRGWGPGAGTEQKKAGGRGAGRELRDEWRGRGRGDVGETWGSSCLRPGGGRIGPGPATDSVERTIVSVFTGIADSVERIIVSCSTESKTRCGANDRLGPSNRGL